VHPPSRASLPASKPDLRKIGLHPNFWYPLALAKDIKKGKTLAVAFAGDPIVLVRTESNKIFAFEDRCAHRQMPLSLGIVVGESLQCCYHAWTYNEHGKCLVPYLPKGAAPPRGIRTYPVREAYGLIFVFPGDAQLADTVPFPDVPELKSREYAAVTFVRRVNCHYSFMHENLMDMSHQFLHRRWMGRFKHKELAVRKKGDSVEVDYTFDPNDGGIILKYLFPHILGSHAAGKMNGGSPLPVDSDDRPVHDSDFMTIGTRYPYQTLRLRRPGLEPPMLKLWLTYVPMDREQRTCQPCGVIMVRKPRFSWLVLMLQPLFDYFFSTIFEEDRVALEAEQRAYDLQGGDWNQEILPFILDLRDLLILRGVPIEPRSRERV
jgi:phenylpropionate dioxygenase-like ring-hydroxylating dioxygenase large terminal subunit